MSLEHLQVLADDLMNSMKAAKEHNTTEHQMRMDLRPLGLLIGNGPDNSFQVPLVSICDDPTHEHHDQVDLLAMAIARYRNDHGFPHIVAVATEGYMTQKMDRIPERGDLRRDFESNPESNVTEALVVYVAGHGVIPHTFDMTALMQPYAYGEMASITWGEVVRIDTENPEWTEVLGRIPETIASAWAPIGE